MGDFLRWKCDDRWLVLLEAYKSIDFHSRNFLFVINLSFKSVFLSLSLTQFFFLKATVYDEYCVTIMLSA